MLLYEVDSRITQLAPPQWFELPQVLDHIPPTATKSCKAVGESIVLSKIIFMNESDFSKCVSRFC